MNKFIHFFLENKLVTYLILLLFILAGIVYAPFDWKSGLLPRDPIPVDAIPDIGENQQIVYTEWPGRSPQDIEDQISYPLTTSLLGIPGVKTIRSSSIFGLSSIYVIFDEGIDFYWSRTRILEKLNSLPAGLLPEDAKPALGPDATALGQVFWYTLEGRDENGDPSGGWDPQELRTLQDFYVRYALTSAKGVSEVATIGGFVKEYQVEIDPDAMKAYKVNVAQIMMAVQKSNLDMGARTLEFNRAEYLIRALGYLKNIQDLEESVVAVNSNVPVRLKDVAHVQLGPATRRGGLDKDGAEAVGGVIVARYGANPMEVIQNVKDKIRSIEAGLPSKTLKDGKISKVTVVPFYDRTGLIKETLGTLEEALNLEILISILVVIILILNLRASILISSLLPIGVLMTFILMHFFGVNANIVALSGIAIAIGVMVDVGVVFAENIIRHLEFPENKGATGRKLLTVIYESVTEVATAVITALSTTVISFLPVFFMQAAEGKLFKPLAYTKTFAMLSALMIGLMFIPLLAHLIFSIKIDKSYIRKILNIALAVLAIVLFISEPSILPMILLSIAAIGYFSDYQKGRNAGLSEHAEGSIPAFWNRPGKWVIHKSNFINIGLVSAVVVYFLSTLWMPLGAGNSLFANFLFVLILVALILGAVMSVVHFYSRILAWCLDNKWKFLSIPITVVLVGILSWQGFGKIFRFVPESWKESGVFQSINGVFPGTGKEFMPNLDEGSFLLMPTSMPHSGIQENLDIIRRVDVNVSNIPEVESVVGKWGRVNSALDPAPTSMYENIINYKPEYILNEKGHRMRFQVNSDGAFVLKNGSTYDPAKDAYRTIKADELNVDAHGEYFRQWRKEIHSPDDIWNKIVENSRVPGLTSAPKLQPIQTRLVMLQTGMRAPMGIKVYGPDLESIEKTGLALEQQLKQVPGVDPASVFADRVVGKPYLEIVLDRKAMARYGLTVKDLDGYIGGAIGGMQLSTTVEGRERFPVRARYAREFRDSPDELARILIPTPTGVQVPLGDVTTIRYTRGPQMIKSEDTFLVGYVIFDKHEGYAEVDVVENASAYLDAKMKTGELKLPAGVHYTFTGNYENEVRATRRLLLVVPMALILIFMILYFQFKSVITASMTFSGILVAFGGGFLMIWLYGQPWFMDFSIAGMNMRDLFQMHTINLSVAVWVGFIALFGVATDDGVIMGTYLQQVFSREKPTTVAEVRRTVLHAGQQRVRPAMMTAATTIIALIPVLTSTGKGSDIMVPMAIPSFGGMIIQVMTMFVVPVLYSMWQERKIKG